MKRRSFLAGGVAALVLSACGGKKKGDDGTSAVTTVPGPGAGNPDDVLLRTGAALSLAAAEKNPGAADTHRAHAALLDETVTAPHPQAMTTWASAPDAELAVAATFQAWTAVLSTPALRQRVMSAGASVSRLYVVALGESLGAPPSLPESFQLTDPAVPDSWLLR